MPELTSYSDSDENTEYSQINSAKFITAEDMKNYFEQINHSDPISSLHIDEPSNQQKSMKIDSSNKQFNKNSKQLTPKPQPLDIQNKERVLKETRNLIMSGLRYVVTLFLV